MSFLKRFKKQNWGIKIGYISLVVSIIVLTLSLILIGTANFVPKNSNAVSANIVGNGFEVMYKNDISQFLTTQGYWNFKTAYTAGDGFISSPLIQLVIGIVFLVILLPIFAGVAFLSLVGGYFKKWLYS